MDAHPCPISEFFNGTKQMLVPLFQRSYEWSDRHWERLWDDLLEQYEKQGEELFVTHFTGAIVTAPAHSVPVSGDRRTTAANDYRNYYLRDPLALSKKYAAISEADQAPHQRG